MLAQDVVVKSGSGLHAKPATVLVRMASGHDCNVFIEKDGERGSAKSILAILALNVSTGTNIKIVTDGPGEKEALQELVEYIESLRDYM